MEHNFFYSASMGRPGNEGDGFKAKAANDRKDENNYREIDLNEQLIKNKTASFFMRVNSEAMSGAGIHSGDIVIVDRALEAGNGRVIIAVVNGEMLIRRYEVNNSKRMLVPATNKLSPIDIVENSEFSVWGVVTYVIRSVW